MSTNVIRGLFELPPEREQLVAAQSGRMEMRAKPEEVAAFLRNEHEADYLVARLTMSARAHRDEYGAATTVALILQIARVMIADLEYAK